MRVDSFKIDVQIITFNLANSPRLTNHAICLPWKPRLFPESRKLPPPDVCHWPRPATLATLPLSLRAGVTVSVSGPGCWAAGTGLSLSFSGLCLSVGSVPSPQVLSHNQSSGERTHRDISAATTREHTAISDLVTKPLLSSSINVSVTFNLLGREILASNWEWS